MRSQPFNRSYPLTAKKVDRAADALARVDKSRDFPTFSTVEERAVLHDAHKALIRIATRVGRAENEGSTT
jgi:hypothetical protein